MSSQPTTPLRTAEEPALVHAVAPGTELLETAAATLRMLAEPTRLYLLWQLAQGPKTVTELTTGATLPRPVVSQHLVKLRLSGLADGPPHPGNHQPRRPPDHRRTRPRLTGTTPGT